MEGFLPLWKSFSTFFREYCKTQIWRFLSCLKNFFNFFRGYYKTQIRRFFTYLKKFWSFFCTSLQAQKPHKIKKPYAKKHKDKKNYAVAKGIGRIAKRFSGERPTLRRFIFLFAGFFVLWRVLVFGERSEPTCIKTSARHNLKSSYSQHSPQCQNRKSVA